MSCILLIGRYVDKCRKTNSVSIFNHVKTVLNDDPVFFLDRHYVGDSTDSYEVRILLNDAKSGLHSAVAASELLVRADELEYHAYTRELLKGIITVGTVGVDYRGCLRKIETALVVVGDKEIDTDALCVCNLFVCGYTGINCDDKLCSALLDAINSTDGNTVSLTRTVGNVVLDICAERFEIEIESSRLRLYVRCFC